jgi:DNA-binding NtrC family response regulator
MQAKLLVIGDNSILLKSMCVRQSDVEISLARKSWDEFCPEELRVSDAQLILVNAWESAEKARVLFEWLRKTPISIPMLAVLPQTTDPGLWDAASKRIDDFVLWPTREEEIILRLTRLLRPEPMNQIQRALSSEMALRQLVGAHPSFLRVVEQTRLYASSSAPVLITGETGTGKEMFAHAIHSLSIRKDGPFIPVDCAGFPEQLAENELYGHKKGAFTSAQNDEKGLVAMAEGGTLFLDEIDSLSLTSQPKLLRLLQEGTYRPLGSNHFVRADVRVIAATNQRIEELVRQRQFRHDLYFRLNVLRLGLPPLRERVDDVLMLARHFLAKECAAAKSDGKLLSAAALRKLESYDWPGNVRELMNTVQRAFVSSQGSQILAHHISLGDDTAGSDACSYAGKSFRSAKQQAVEQFEQAYVEELLRRHEGNITRAAQEARKERRAFGRLVKKYDLGSEMVDRIC